MKKTKSVSKTITSLKTNDVCCEQTKCKCNPILYVLIFMLVIFSGYLFYKVNSLEKKLATGGSVQEESPLSVDNLKKYAKEIGVNTGKFNSCLDKNEKKSAVTADMNYAASVGIQGTPGFFINGRLLAGAFPFEYFKEIIDKEIAGTGSDNCLDYSEDLQKYCSDPQNKAFDPVAKKIETGNSPFEGAKKPKVTIVEFSDFECPFCSKAYPTVKKIVDTYKNDVVLYFKQFPLSFHKYAQKAAEASLCVYDQGNDKFWKFHDKLFELQQTGN